MILIVKKNIESLLKLFVIFFYHKITYDLICVNFLKFDIKNNIDIYKRTQYLIYSYSYTCMAIYDKIQTHILVLYYNTFEGKIKKKKNYNTQL